MKKLLLTVAAVMLAAMLFVPKVVSGQTASKGYYLEKYHRGFYIERKRSGEGDGFM